MGIVNEGGRERRQREGRRDDCQCGSGSGKGNKRGEGKGSVRGRGVCIGRVKVGGWTEGDKG